ncbi:hypothetical protein HYC85_021921 [Camellia sinensis]|uniref:Uncharacterized protein n=1 Tax=Camellia sinensis TaxID=4442 RepID=A0A7J7GMU9_CAMSI|nr:hypothetical protein HYC85_021921 [Camellia sinensis]
MIVKSLGSASHCNVTVDIDIAMTTGTTLQDQKKRTLDALQRRFALAEAELHLQQQKNKKRPHEENKGTTHNVNSSSANVTDALPSSNASSKKGKFSFSGHAATQGRIREMSFISDRRGSIVNQVVHDLLQSGDSAQKYMQGSRSMKIDNWILLDNLVQGRGASRGARIRALKTHSKRSKKHMSMKQHKKCGTLDLPQELHKENQLTKCLLTADLHGAMILEYRNLEPTTSLSRKDITPSAIIVPKKLSEIKQWDRVPRNPLPAIFRKSVEEFYDNEKPNEITRQISTKDYMFCLGFDLLGGVVRRLVSTETEP